LFLVFALSRPAHPGYRHAIGADGGSSPSTIAGRVVTRAISAPRCPKGPPLRPNPRPRPQLPQATATWTPGGPRATSASGSGRRVRLRDIAAPIGSRRAGKASRPRPALLRTSPGWPAVGYIPSSTVATGQAAGSPLSRQGGCQLRLAVHRMDTQDPIHVDAVSRLPWPRGTIRLAPVVVAGATPILMDASCFGHAPGRHERYTAGPRRNSAG